MPISILNLPPGCARGCISVRWGRLATPTLYETVTQAHNRILYGSAVTSTPHVRRELVDVDARLIGMRLFSGRAVDYFRSAHAEDRRLLFNPVTKMKVTTEAERVIDPLADVARPRASRRRAT